ncbi:MAG: hypothetical protein U0X39_15940 [Bacteroidales bacterium]
MKKVLLFTAAIVIALSSVMGQTKMTADTEKTKMEWLGEKVVGQHNGTINLQSGWLTMKENKIVGGEFLIDMASLKRR